MSASTEDNTILRATDIRKVYGGEVALAGVSLQVAPGEIHGLLGANGAGKSTLIRIISGAEVPDGGAVEIAHQRLRDRRSAMANRLGVALIHQDRALVDDLSIADNIALVIGYPRRRGLIDQSEVNRRAEEALARVGMHHDPGTLVRDLPIADQTLVAIARALATQAQLIILDEPTANLSANESQDLYARLRALAAEGVASLLITHALNEALEVCDRVTVLRDGMVVAACATNTLSEEELNALVVGREVAKLNRPQGRAAPGATDLPRLALRNLQFDRLSSISLEVGQGEIVGVTGIADSGHLLLGELLAGTVAPESGEMLLDGEPYRPASPAAARAAGLAYVPSDRIRDGLAVDMSLRENLFLDGAGVPSRWGIPKDAEISEAASLLAHAGVRPPDPEEAVATLSGGNMQRLLIAKWLATNPRVLVLCEPTVGVDVGARQDIYVRLREACDRGLAVLLASSDFEEIALLCHRVIVLRYGDIAGRLDDEISVERITSLSSNPAGGRSYV